MEDQLITLPTAVLARRYGFMGSCERAFRWETDDLDASRITSVGDWRSGITDWNYMCSGMGFEFYARPAQYQLQCWLREFHGLHICSFPVFDDEPGSLCTYRMYGKRGRNDTPWIPWHGAGSKYQGHVDYEVALEEALQAMLRLLPVSEPDLASPPGL
jgi:hypothetical protein